MRGRADASGPSHFWNVKKCSNSRDSRAG